MNTSSRCTTLIVLSCLAGLLTSCEARSLNRRDRSANRDAVTTPSAARADASDGGIGAAQKTASREQEASQTQDETAEPAVGVAELLTSASGSEDVAALAPSTAQEKAGPQEAPKPPVGSGAPGPKVAEGPELPPGVGAQGAAQSGVDRAAGLSAECKATYEQLVKLRQGIPLVFSNLRRTQDEIDADIRRSIDLGKEFLAAKECKDTKAALWVKSWLARDLFTRVDRVKEDFVKRYKVEAGLAPNAQLGAAQARQFRARADLEIEAYNAEIDELLTGALPKLSPGSEEYCNAVSLIADKIFHRKRDMPRFREFAERFQEHCGDHLGWGKNYHYDIGTSYLLERRYGEALQYIEKVVEERPDDERHVLHNDIKYQALWALADLGGIEDLTLSMKPLYAERLKNAGAMKPIYRGQYEQWYLTCDFFCGMARYAMGDVAGSLAKMREYIERVDALEQRLAAQGKRLPNVPQIFRDFRARDYVYFFSGSQTGRTEVEQSGWQGRVPAVDLDKNIRWVSGNPTTLAASRGKVVALMFRGPNNLRSRDFFLTLERMQREQSEDLVALNLYFVQARMRDEVKLQRFDAMAKEVKDLGVTMPSGFDVSQGNAFFKACHATMGSPSFVLLDRQGKIAWYHADPNPRDIAVLESVLERLVASE